MIISFSQWMTGKKVDNKIMLLIIRNVTHTHTHTYTKLPSSLWTVAIFSTKLQKYTIFVVSSPLTKYERLKLTMKNVSQRYRYALPLSIANPLRIYRMYRRSKNLAKKLASIYNFTIPPVLAHRAKPSNRTMQVVSDDDSIFRQWQDFFHTFRVK